VRRTELYRLPWSKADNPGGWLEPTDSCDLSCPGCFRRRLTGHRPLEELKADIVELRRRLNCDRIAIAGGEPLLYPAILDLVGFVRDLGLKPMVLSNGTRLTRDLARALKQAGLHTLYLHVDAGQDRPGWENCSEREMNALRQHFADLLFEVGGIQCGFNITVTRRTFEETPDVIAWALQNIRKVKHLSLIAFRALPLGGDLTYQLNGERVPEDQLPNLCPDKDEISIATEEMYALVERHYPHLEPSAYLGGSAVVDSHKFLIIVAVGAEGRSYGSLGARSVELGQIVHHVTKGRYTAAGPGRLAGVALAVLALFDRSARRALGRLVLSGLANPIRWLAPVDLLTINLQQPFEVLGEDVNLCDGCVNMMLYKGELIHSCRLDEYRLFGGPLVPVPRAH
jgi:hypothetical protein